jgi:hypothetical protein
VKQERSGLLARVSTLFFLALLVFGIRANTQTISGEVVGTIYDKSGAVIPEAAVVATDPATGVKHPTKANSSGEYRLSNLPPGVYNISATAPSFASTTVNGFKVDLNRTITLNITLELKGQVTSIEVTSETPSLDLTTPTISTTFEQAQLNLPSVSANGGSGILNLSLLTAGVVNVGAMGAGAGPAIGGQRPRNNNFTVEGLDNNSKNVTGPLFTVPNDSIQEFTLLQNDYSPEFGHSNGGQFNFVLKSGTNSFHGTAYEYFANRNLNAVDQAVKNQGLTSNPRYDNNRFGGNIGGPILKNKLFFFFSGQYNPVGQASVPGAPICSPTTAGYTTLNGISGLSANNLTQFATYATPAPTGGNCPTAPATDPRDPSGNTPNANGDIFISDASAAGGFTPVQVGIFPVVAPNYTNNKTFMGKIDYNISDTDRLSGSYFYNNTYFIDNTAQLPVFFQLIPGNINRLVTFNEYHTFSPSLANEFKLGFNRQYQNFTVGDFNFPGTENPDGSPNFPNLSFDELGLNLGPDPNAPQYSYQNIYTAADNLTWTKGRHSLKFGIEGRKYIAPAFFTQRARGDYEWSSLDVYLHDLAPDVFGERSSGTTVYYGDQSAVYWYVNDTWKIRPNLTVNLGVRYEYTTIPVGERAQALNQAASVPGLIDFSEPRAPRNNWGPRIGIAYSPGSSGNTSIRAGFAIGYDVLYDNIGSLSLPPQQSGTIDCPSAQCPATNFLASGGIPSTVPVFADVAEQRAATANYVRVNQISPQSITWTLGVQRTFLKNYTVEVRYVGTSGIHLNGQTRLNAGALINNTVFLPTYVQDPGQAALDALPYTFDGIASGAYSTPENGLPLNGSTIVPAFDLAGFNGSYLVSFQPNGHSTYHGLATQVTRRMARGLQFTGSYTWSHTIDDSTADFFSTILTPRRPQDFQDLKNDRSNSALDHRHRFTLALLYDLPYFKSGNWAKRNILGNWEFAPIYTFQTGQWIDVQSGNDANVNGDSAGDRAIFNPDGIAGTGTAVTPLTNSGGDVVAYLANDPSAQYIRLGTFALANAGRNTLKMQAINDWDFTITKKFNFTERTSVQFFATAYNLFNHAQFNPGFLNDVGSISFVNGNVRTFLNPANKTFNNFSGKSTAICPSTCTSVFPSNARTMQLGLKFSF